MTAGSSGEPLPRYRQAMKTTEMFWWWIVDPRAGKRRKTTYRLTREDAERQFPGAEPDLLSVEVRMLPESPAEYQFNSAWQRKE